MEVLQGEAWTGERREASTAEPRAEQPAESSALTATAATMMQHRLPHRQQMHPLMTTQAVRTVKVPADGEAPEEEPRSQQITVRLQQALAHSTVQRRAASMEVLQGEA